jgi:hypothetical protein
MLSMVRKDEPVELEFRGLTLIYFMKDTAKLAIKVGYPIRVFK